MMRIKVGCEKCGNVFDWDDRLPAGLKKCPLCGILLGAHSQATPAGQEKYFLTGGDGWPGTTHTAEVPA